MTRHEKGGPNKFLPAGAEPITPKILTFGGYVALKFDAKVERFGVTWYRVAGGMGGDGSREDWIAELSIYAAVHNYNWDGSWCDFLNKKSFDAACKYELDTAEKTAKRYIRELRVKRANLIADLKTLRKARA